MPLQFRRGTNSERLNITPDSGEPIFTTDTKKLFVGDGSTAGGVEVTGTDSATILGLIDSAYIQARQVDIYRDSAFINTLINAADTHDSAAIQGQITSTVNKAFVDALNINADTLDAQDGAYYLDYTNFTNTPTIPTLGNDYVDSAQVSAIIAATDLVDSADVAAIIAATDLVDSADVSAIIIADVDAAFINALTIDADTLCGQNSAYHLDYNNFTNTPTIPTLGTDFVDSAEVNTLIDTRVNKTFVDALNVDADTLDNQDGTYYLDYTNFTNTPTLPTLGTDFVDSVEARELISVTDAGGDGSLSYNNSTGVITYTGPSASEVRAHFSAGTGVTISSGQISIGQSVGTSDSVTFSNITADNLTVNGTTTTVNSITYTVVDPLLHLADSNETSDVVDIGFIGHYSPDGGTTKEHTGFFRDASNGEYYIFNGLQDAAFDSTVPTNIVDRAGTGFTLANFNVNSLAASGTVFGNTTGNHSGDVYTPTGSHKILDVGTNGTDATLIADVTGDLTGTVTGNVFGNTTGNHNGDVYNSTGSTLILNANNTPSAILYADVQGNVTGNLTGNVTAGSGSSSFFDLTATNSANLNNVTIVGGTMESVIIGAATPLDITGTTITAQVGFIGNVIGTISSIANHTTDSLSEGSTNLYYTAARVDSDITATINHAFLANVLDDSTLTIDGNGSTGGVTIQDGGITIRSGTGSVAYADFYCEVSNAHRTRIQSDAHANYSGNVDLTLPTTTGTLALTTDITNTIDSAYINARVTAGTDSAATIALITATVDSAYVALREANSGGGGGSGTVDSAQTISLIQTTVDSSYVNNLVDGRVGAQSVIAPIAFGSVADITSGSGTNLNWGNWNSGNSSLDFTFDTPQPDTNYSVVTDCEVFDDAFVQVTNKTTAGFTASFYSDTQDLAPSSFREFTFIIYGSTPTVSTGGGAAAFNINKFNYTATAGQTTFTGADVNGTTLSYSSGMIMAHLNGFLLKETVDYTANNGTSLVLTAAADSGNELTITSFSGGKVYPGGINTFSFVADSGQTIFSGTDANGTTLEYSAGNTQVFLNGILLDEADYTATNGSSIVLASAADSADYINIASYHMLQSSVWNTTSTNINASAGDKLIVDVSSGVVTVTLPSSPSMGDEVRIIDGEGNAATNNITVARNGNKIQASDSDFVIDINRAGIGFVYYNVNNGWVLIEK